MKQPIDLNRILLFTKIVEAGNITRAAEQMGEPKAKLSRNLAQLESDLGLQLVYRTTRQFHLTDTGLRFYQSAKERVDGLIEAVDSLKSEDNEVSGMIRVTAPSDFGIHVLTPIVDDFSKLYPKTEFDLIYTNEYLDLVKLGVDVAIRAGRGKDSSLIQRKAATIRLMMVASPKYLDRVKPLTAPEQLSEHLTIGFMPLPNRNFWQLHSPLGRKSLKLTHRFTANNVITIRDLALSGHGIAYLPAFLVQHLVATGELVHVLKTWSANDATLAVVVPNQKQRPNRIRAFVDFTVKRLGEVL